MNIMPSTQNVTNNNEASSSANDDLLDEWNELGEGSEDENEFNVEQNDNSPTDSCQQTLRRLCERTLSKLSQYFRDEVFTIC